MNLIWQKRMTHAGELLLAGQDVEGITVTCKKGWTDARQINQLVSAGWLETRAAGPRGGKRFFTTDAGMDAMFQALMKV